MSIVKEGLVRVFSKTWQDVRLQLHSSGKLSILPLNPTSDVKAETVALGPLSIAILPTDSTYMVWGASEQVFVVKIDLDSRKDLFFGIAQTQECRRWMELINFITLRKALEAKHIHPLTPVLGPLAYNRRIVIKSVLSSTGRRMVCGMCQTMSREEAYQCEFCDDYVLCPACLKHFNELQSPFVETPYHPFPLIDPAKAGTRFEIHGNHPKKFTCDICSQVCPEKDTFRCVECDAYAECRACVATRVKPAVRDTPDLCLEPKFLAPVLTVQHNMFTLNSARLHKCPRAASVIANRPWDLSTIDDAPPSAYFEVTFHKLNDKDGKVSVGLGNQIFVQNQLLGYQQNSFGYYSDGFASQNTNQNVQQSRAFKEGDTVGVGILLDSFHQRRIFFTINGEMVGTYSERVHVGMDCFPGVSFTKGSEVQFSVNMTGRFKFDLHNIPDYRTAKTSHFAALPHEIALHCLVLVSPSYRQTCELRLVNKQYANLALENDIWKGLYLSTFKNQNANLKVKSWYTMYMRRHVAGNDKKSRWMFPRNGIENCAMEFECPLMWESLAANQQDNTRQCDKCHKTVYKVDNLNTLQEYIQMGRCVSLQFPTWRSSGLMGVFAGPPPVPEIIPAPFEIQELCNLSLPPYDDDDL